MTTYQDPPLQSRRASRQGERPEAQPSSFDPPQVPRTAAGAGEPLNYVTQNRPPLPGYDTAPPRGRRSSEPAPAAQPPQQSFRPRDFSPEGRSVPPVWAPESDRGEGVLDHHTQARAAVEPPAGASLAASLSSEQTLSRRELRAIRDSSGLPAAPADTPLAAPPQQQYAPPAPVSSAPPPVAQPVPPQFVAPPQAPAPQQYAPPAPAPQQTNVPLSAPAPAPSTHLDSAMAEFDALAGRSAAPAGSRRAGRRAAPQADVAPEDGLGVFDPVAIQRDVHPVAPVAPAPQPALPTDYAPVAVPVEPAPMAPAQFRPAPVVEPVASVPPSTPVPIAEPTTAERSVGHWTTQSDLDDAVQVNESTISRTVGSGALTTSALVLPSIPGHDMATGHVMLTDSISLPSSFAETGSHRPIDESDIDHLLDPGDHQLVNTDSVPIRAIRAVSGHSSARAVISSAKPQRGGRALTALIVSASGMVLVVVTLLVVALVTEVI